ncbi:acyl-CoA dehydrogenase family protein [Botrimarina hoheduenensis]|uniref:Acyl-CoA dehydrogenase n=1 Tax=Botrimarina hoheduenensis TaxID=2528000 RepID=A0A5C5W7M5_9BACT|nr:acyl-CoA dehydrogenase family protein [Botrimarina hoheduenensis]TWT46906.1 Acyl-CoA dehydrogenase [Botrimarina hoheduenensis]
MATDLNTTDPLPTHPVTPPPPTVAEHDAQAVSFAETALKLGGKSDDEARRTGAIDRADDEVEALFAPRYQTTHSPAHRAVWERTVPAEEFIAHPAETSPVMRRVIDASLETVRRHLRAQTLYGDDDRIREEVLAELGVAGYWGLLVDREHGGVGASFTSVAQFLTQMATLDGTIAGLASIHGCIGAVDPVKTFGDEAQRRRWLPRLASGERLSAFALTEPGAGSDLTALRTTAVLDGDHYVVNGEKLFISNVRPGRTIGLVCLVEGKPAVLIVDLPDEEDEHFQLKKYDIYALRHLYNRGIVFRNFRVPKGNLLTPPKGDGLTIAYHGLNLGRVSLCANAAGSMRAMLAGMLPWAEYRVTYSEPIAHRELVRRRMGEMAGLIVACDALVAWCGSLLDRGYRGEMECIIAKIFGSEALKHAAIELYMKTHGGRSFLKGHPLGDNVHDFLAPCIYEGEGEMLGMAFFKSLVKDHGKRYYEPVGKALAAAGIRQPNPLNPRHALLLARPAAPYLKWLVGRKLRGVGTARLPSDLPAALRAHAAYACAELPRMALAIDAAMQKHQLRLADRQCRMAELSQRTQDLITVLVTALYAGRHADPLVRDAGDLLCEQLRQKLTGARPTDRYYKRITALGERIAKGEAAAAESLGLATIEPPPILERYDR